MTPPEEQNTGEVGEANADGENKGNDGETKEEDKQNPEGDANATIDLNGGLAGVRTMVAALKTALGFTVQLSGTVANLSNLLTSSTASDVTEAIGLLVRMRQFNVDGATDGVRRLLGLIFARRANHQGCGGRGGGRSLSVQRRDSDDRGRGTQRTRRHRGAR